MITEKRKSRLKSVAACRQNFTVILENVHDIHNIGAVLRSCDAVGVHEIFVLYTEDRYDSSRFENLKSSSTGVKKWMNIHFYRNAEACMTAVRKNYNKIYATHLSHQSKSIYDVDMKEKIAFLFGNEHEGVSKDALSFVDGNVLIPQFGMVQSLNISVACAVTIFECMRQRIVAGLYNPELEELQGLQNELFDKYVEIHNASYKKT